MPKGYGHALIAVAALVLALAAGCHQLDSPAALSWQAGRVELPSAQASEPVAGPPSEAPLHLGKSTVNDPDLPRRCITLAECIALALENGRTGAYFDGPGSTQRTSVTGLTDMRNPTTATDSIRVFAQEPGIAATNIEESLSRFDAYVESSFFWDRIDQANRFLTPLTPFDQVTNRNKVDDFDFSAGVYRRLPTGGFAGFRFRNETEYNFLAPNSGVIDPAFRPRVEFLFEQPLLQGAGLFINDLRDVHPGSIRQTLPDLGKPPGILLTRISHRQQQLEFERQVHELVYRVEEAYWQLYAAYWDLYSSDNGMKQAHASWQTAKARFDAGGLAVEDLAMIEEQYHFFRQQRLQALGRGQPGRPGVLEAERRLRYVVGLPPDDGCRLTPQDAPDYLAYEVDVDLCVTEAEQRRPEIRQVDEEIKAAYLNIEKAKDRLKPDLRFVGRYGINGLGDDLGDAFNDLSHTPHHDWEVGLRLQYPIGFRAGYAELTRARIQLRQRLTFLKDQREKLLFSLQRSHQELVQYREQYKVRIRQREAAALQLKARSDKFKAGGDPKMPGSFIDLLLRAQRNWADAVREEYVALCNYRIAITDFERQKGTILQYANVAIAEGPVPASAKPRASDYLRHRLRPFGNRNRTGDPELPIEVEGTFPLPAPTAALQSPPPPRATLGTPSSDPARN